MGGAALHAFAPMNGFSAPAIKNLTAAYELIARAGLTHVRPALRHRHRDGRQRGIAVTEEAAHVTPFGTLLHFKKDIGAAQPRVLLVAPLSGHFATLLRNTVKTMLPEHDVYITDWHNARDAPLSAGRFGFDDYVEHLIQFLEIIGPGAHVVAVCQPCVATLVAAAVMAQTNNPAQPRSMTLMAGPIDCRVNPTKVNELATSKPIAWFEQNLIASVPMRYPGAFRRVYPGFVQLAAFMSMNIDRHVKAHRELYDNLVAGELAKAAETKAFYDEYFAVLDLTAEFYLETVRIVFQEYALATGTLKFRGEPVEPRAISRTALFTVEGEKDDICAVGQTLAAQDLCSSDQALPQAPPHAARRRALRRVLRQEMGNADLSAVEEHDPVERLNGDFRLPLKAAACAVLDRTGPRRGLSRMIAMAVRAIGVGMRRSRRQHLRAVVRIGEIIVSPRGRLAVRACGVLHRDLNTDPPAVVHAFRKDAGWLAVGRRELLHHEDCRIGEFLGRHEMRVCFRISYRYCERSDRPPWSAPLPERSSHAVSGCRKARGSIRRTPSFRSRPARAGHGSRHSADAGSKPADLERTRPRRSRSHRR